MNATIPTLTAKEQLIVSVISDHIIFQRIAMSMRDVLNAINPSKGNEDFAPDAKYNGITIALDLLGVTYDDVNHNGIGYFRDALYNSFSEYVCNNTENCEKLAITIYYDWLRQIKDYYTSKKAV